MATISAEEIGKKLRFAYWGTPIFGWYGTDEVKAGYPYWECNDCQFFKVTIKIPTGIWEALNSEEGRLDEVKEAFNRLLNKYLPVYAQLLDANDEENVILEELDPPTVQVSAPPEDIVTAEILVIDPDKITIENTGSEKEVQIYSSDNFEIL